MEYNSNKTRDNFFLFTGEPGVGKSTLGKALSKQAQVPVFLMGQGQEMRASWAYHIFSQVLQTYFATVPPELANPKNHALINDFSTLVPDLSPMLSDLPAPPSLEPKQEHLRLMTSVTQFIKQATQKRPWLIIFRQFTMGRPREFRIIALFRPPFTHYEVDDYWHLPRWGGGIWSPFVNGVA